MSLHDVEQMLLAFPACPVSSAGHCADPTMFRALWRFLPVIVDVHGVYLQHCSQRYEYLRNSTLSYWHFSPYSLCLKIGRAGWEMFVYSKTKALGGANYPCGI